MPGDPAYPAVPESALDGWTLTEESVETLFQLPAASVRGATRRYEDERLREEVRNGTDGEVDHELRFFAATRLGFSPGLPPGTMPAMILPTVRSEAKRAFKQRLRERGVEDVERSGRERMRVRSGARARLTRYDGVNPAVGLADHLGIAADGLSGSPATYRDELLDLFRDVA